MLLKATSMTTVGSTSSEALIRQGMLLEILRQLGDLGVGQSGVGLADSHQTVALLGADRERVVGEDAVPLAVTVLDRRHHHVERGERPLQLQPRLAAASWCVRRTGRLHHHAFIATRQGVLESPLKFVGGAAWNGGRQSYFLVDSLAGRGAWLRRAFRLRRAREQSFQATSAFAQRPVEQKCAITVEEIKDHVDGGNLAHRPGACREVRPQTSLQVGRLAAQALLELGEGQRTPVAPSDDLAVQDELTRQSGKGREELRKLADRVERTREKPRVLARLVRLSANPIVFVFDLRALGEVLHCLGGGLRGARQHESDGMEQREMRLAEFVCGSEAEGCANVAGEHVGALHLLWRLRKGVRDGQFDETFLEADSQVAGDDLDDVLRLDRCRASQQFLERDQLLCRASTRRQLVKRCTCVGERQRSSSSLPRQNLFRHRAEVAVLPVDGLEALGAGTCDAAQHLPDQGSAGSKNPLFDTRERTPGEEDRGERRVVRWQVAEILAHQAYLLLGARGRGDSVAGLS